MNIGTVIQNIFSFLNDVYEWLTTNWYIVVSISGTAVILFVAFKVMKGLLK